MANVLSHIKPSCIQCQLHAGMTHLPLLCFLSLLLRSIKAARPKLKYMKVLRCVQHVPEERLNKKVRVQLTQRTKESTQCFCWCRLSLGIWAGGRYIYCRPIDKMTYQTIIICSFHAVAYTHYGLYRLVYSLSLWWQQESFEHCFCVPFLLPGPPSTPNIFCEYSETGT